MRRVASVSLLLGGGWGFAGVIVYYVVLFSALRSLLGPGQLTATYVVLQSMLAVLVAMVMYAWRGAPAGAGALATGLVPMGLFVLDGMGVIELPW